MFKRIRLYIIAITGSFILFVHSAFALPLIRDAEVEHTLQNYSYPIFKAAGLKPTAIKIFILNDDRINAFVAGGANMFINTGLIMKTQSPDMLIGVIAHETAHIAGGHLARGAEKLKDAQLGSILSMVIGAAAGLATGKVEAATTIMTGTQTSIMRNFLAYTRSHEEGADQAALGYLDSLNISASGMLKTFSLLQRNERLHSTSSDPYMRSHPLSTQRTEHVRNHVANSKIPEGTYPKRFTMMHKRMRAKLYGFMESPERTMQKYPITNKAIDARMARAIAYYKMPDTDRALSEINSLIEKLPDDPFLYDLKGQILFENNRINDSLIAYQKAKKLRPDSALILVELAKVQLAQPKPNMEAAIGNLETATTIDNSHSYAWRLLATAYGKRGNLGRSALALSEEAMLLNKPKIAIKQVNQAIRLIPKGTPAYQRAQDLNLFAIKMQKEQKDAQSTF